MLRATAFGPVTRLDLGRTLLGSGRYWTTAYLVDEVMVDTGPAHAREELLAWLADRPLNRILTTHTHEDHIGAHGALQRRHAGLEILAHPLALPVLADPRGRQPLHPYRRLFWGWPEPSHGLPVVDSQEIHCEHYTFRVIETPGHSPDHICLYEPDQGWIFSGDLFVGGEDRALRAGYDIWQIIASLKRIQSLPAERLFAGSARVRDDPSAALSRKIEYLEELGDRVLRLDREGKSAGEIARQLMGGPMWIEWITLGHFTRRRLVLSYLRRNSDRTA